MNGSYDLYPIITNELLKLYSLEDKDKSINTLYKYIYVRCSIFNNKKEINNDELMLFILNELNISILCSDKDNKVVSSNSPYVIYKKEKYYIQELISELMENFKFRAEFEDELNIKELISKIYVKGYRKAYKYKELLDHELYIKYYRLKALNEEFSIYPMYSMGIKGFTNSLNHNPYKRSIEENLESTLQASKFIGSKTTSHISEENLEDYIVKNIELVEKGLVFLKRQVEIPGGIIDILAMDKNNEICIIEVKIKEDKSIIWQALHYPKEMRNIYRNYKLRMITIAPSYSEHILNALLELDNIEIMDYEIQVNEGNISKLKINTVKKEK